MVIPAQFKLFNQTIKVIYKRDLISKKGAFGLWDYNKNKIYLQQSTKENILTEEQVHQTFIHEATHSCLDLMGRHDLSKDEVFVSTFSNLIHQFIVEINA